MLQQFLNHIEHHALCTPSDKVLLAVSGGVDSTAMLHLFRAAGYRFSVAHCNFQLRGKESDGDEEFVRALCHNVGVPFYSTRFDTEAYAWENDLSTQMAARELRYAWFDALLHEHGYTHLATAHHFDDTMETMLLHWTRGGTVDGLAGIPVKNRNVIRPLLFATRAQVEAYAREQGIAWREDSSNLTDDYQRNFIRHQVIPRLKEINPSLEATLQHGLDKLQSDIELIHDGVERWKKEFLSVEGEKVVIDKRGVARFRYNAPLLWRCIREYGFNFDQAQEIVHGLNGQPGKRFLSPAFQLVIDRAFLFITPHQHHWTPVTIQASDSRAAIGPWEMAIRRDAAAEPGTDSLEAVLDSATLTYPLVWRQWKAGDYFYPLGMEHKRKLSDFFIDKKLSRADKDSVTVLESGGQIAWIVGYRIDNRFRLTDRTRAATAFTVSPYFM